MDIDIAHSELLSLIEATKEQIKYLTELGLETGNTPKTRLEKKVSTPPASSAQANFASAPLHDARPLASISTTRPGSSFFARTGPSKPRDAGSPLALFGDLAPSAETINRTSETFEEIWADLRDCTRCPLHQCRTNVVHTEGNRKARLMFVGEAPGADEDEQSRPFVGRAGQLLTRIIESIGFKREEVLIGNVNRCRPPGNRAPTSEEAAMCKPFLLREIAVVQPEIIVVLGNTAMKNLLDVKEGITKLRGQFQDFKGIKVMPTFHPAYLLRDPSKKRETWEDLKKVREYLDRTRENRIS